MKPQEKSTGENRVIIGTVPYLNARPLVRWFSDTEEGRASGVSVVEAVPSALARMLTAGEVATALVSSVELFRAGGRPAYDFIPGIAIAADGPVESVRLLSRVPLPCIRSVALDSSSLTSVALLKILLKEQYGLEPEYRTAAPQLDRMLETADAALLIGDIGYREYDPSLQTLDLGTGWRELTGLPFVYALWVGYPERLAPALAATLTTARDWGKAHLARIADLEFERLNETAARARHYLSEVMIYDMGPGEQEGLRLFGEKLRQHGLV